MKNTKWIRGALLVAAMAGCQTNTNTGDPKDDSGGTQDISDALAQLPEAEVLMYSADGLPQYIVGDLGRIEAAQDTGLIATDHTLRAALPPLLKAFRLENKDLVLRRVSTDDQGARHYRYAQTFNGVDVVGSELVVHVDAKGSIFGINGTARGDISPTLGATSIRVDAANLSIEADPRWSGVKARSVTGSRVVYVEAADGSRYKAFEQTVEGFRGQDPIRDKVFVNVEDGAIVAVHPKIHHARNRLVYNLNHGTSLPGALARSEGQAPVADIDVNAAYDGTGGTYDLYKNFWNRDSYDNAGAALKSSVHYSNNYCNAFWNSTQMVYGDGSGTSCLPLARGIDVTGHEMTHAVTEYESNLTYSGESGGLNESYSDIFGNGVEAWRDGGSTGTTLLVSSKTFLVGEEILPPALRYMCDPAQDGASADVWSSGLGGIDVHYSSGPNNLVFCLLSKGGMHPRGKTTIPVPPLDPNLNLSAAKALNIYYKAQVDILTASSNYAAMRTAMVQAAAQLGYDQATQDTVACAFAAIKVGTTPAACGGVPPPPDGVLVNDVPQSGLADTAVGNMKFWKLDVPAGQGTLTFTISGGTGDVDMYVQFGAHPSETVYQCRPYLSGNSETCVFTSPAAGTWYVGLRAYAAYSGVSLRGTYGSVLPGDPYLTNGVPVAGVAGATGSNSYWRIAVPAGKNLVVKTSGGTGDADLYTRFGARPTTTTYACRPYASGNNETCTHNNASVGDWYIMVRGFAAYSGVTLVGSF